MAEQKLDQEIFCGGYNSKNETSCNSYNWSKEVILN